MAFDQPGAQFGDGIRFGVAPIPAVAGQPARPFVGVLGCMITAPSRLKDVAREFLEHPAWMTESGFSDAKNAETWAWSMRPIRR